MGVGCIHPHSHTPPSSHMGVRVAWGHGGGCAPPRMSVMGVGHIHVPHPHATWVF